MDLELVFMGCAMEMNVLFWECLLEFALRRVEAEHSDRPMYFVLPAARRESRAGMDWDRGVSRWSLSAVGLREGYEATHLGQFGGGSRDLV